MTQNGPYPGQPSQGQPLPGQPWSAGGSDEPYREPSDPWGDAWGGTPASTPPDAATPPADYATTGGGYPTAPHVGTGTNPTGGQPTGMSSAWPQPVPPAPKRRNGPIVALVVVLGLLICGGLGTTASLLIDRANDNDADAAVTRPTIPQRTTSVPDADPRPQDSQNARFVTKGQCIRNEGTPEKPQMQIVQCSGGTFEVLARVDGRTTGEADAETKCGKIPRYTKWYFYDSELDSLDFVLCLRER